MFLNVYDLYQGNDALAPLGLGFYHTGIEVHGSEYSYGGGGGIIRHSPRNPPTGSTPGAFTPFRLQLVLGEVHATSSEVERVVDGLRSTWLGDQYHILTRNCNSFSDELCIKLLNKRIPGWVNRLAGLGAYFSCCLPANLNPPPPSSTPSSSAASPSPPRPLRGSTVGVGRSMRIGGGGGGGGGASATVAAGGDERAKRAAAAERRAAAMASGPPATSKGAQLTVPSLPPLFAGRGEEEGEAAPLTGGSGGSGGQRS